MATVPHQTDEPWRLTRFIWSGILTPRWKPNSPIVIPLHHRTEQAI